MGKKRNRDSEMEVEDDQTTLHNLHRTMLTIRVGPEKYPFLIHKELLCYHSSFFHVAIKFPQSSPMAEPGIIDLPEEDVETFKIFEHSLYSLGEPISFPYDLEGQSLKITKAYVTADKYGALKLKNRSLEKIRELILSRKTAPCKESIKYTFENTLPSSSLRQLLIDIFAHKVWAETWGDDLLDLPLEFLTGVICVLSKIKKEKDIYGCTPFSNSIDPYLETESPCEDRRRP